MGAIEQKLNAMGVTIPEATTPKGTLKNYARYSMVS